MANLVQELLIRIGIKSDTGQGQQVAETVDKIGGASKKAGAGLAEVGKGARDSAQALEKNIAVGNSAKQLMESLRDVSKGGAAGWLAFGRSVLSFGTVVKTVLLTTGPVGIAIAALGLLAGAALALKDAFKPAGESAEEMGRRIAELNKAKLDRVANEQKLLTEAANEAVAAINSELAAMDKLADIRTARLIEEEKARGKEKGAPSEVTERNITRIRRDAEDAKIGRTLSAADEQARVLEDAASEAEQKRATLDIQRNQLLGLKAKYDQLNEQDVAMRREMLKGYLKRGYAEPEQNAQLSALQRERDAAREKLEKRLGGKDDKEGTLYKDAQKTADEALNVATTAAQAAAKAAEVAAAKASDARGQEGQISPERAKLRAAEDRNARELTAAEKAKIAADNAKARTKQEAQMRALGANVVANRIAGGDTSLDIALARELYPKQKFVQPTAPAPIAQPANPSGVYGAGEALPTNTAGVFRGALPAGPVDPRNQLTFGTLKPGSDNKLGDQTKQLNETMQQAGEKAAEPVDLQPAVDGATAVKEGNEALKAALDSATAAQAEALTAAAQASFEAASTLGTHAAAISSIKAELAAIKSRMAAARVKN